jgi:predicted ArsR family transcriptional regulator
VPVATALRRAAFEAGRAAGSDARAGAGGRPSRSALLDATTEVLRSCGYEPRVAADGVTLANCPFHALAREYTDLVCGMNLDLVAGLVDGLGATELTPRLAPTEGQCCVRIDRTRPRS